MAIEVYCKKVGDLATNCYIVIESESEKALVVDPGDFNAEVEGLLSKKGVKELEYILLTHGHYDHILAVENLFNKYGGKIVAHEKDADCFTNGLKSLLGYLGYDDKVSADIKIKVKDNDLLDFGSSKIKVMYTPGHTEGSVCYLIDNCLFTGDTLFKGSVGRTDFPTGSMSDIMKSVGRIKALKGDYKIFPGHGEETDLAFEKKNNFYMR